MYGIQPTSLIYLYHIAYIEVKKIFKIAETHIHFVRRSLKLCHEEAFSGQFPSFFQEKLSRIEAL